MFLRSKICRKDGKTHRYFSVVGARGPGALGGRVVQRQVLFLGEINDSQQAAWRQTLEVFDEAEQRAGDAEGVSPEDRRDSRRRRAGWGTGKAGGGGWSCDGRGSVWQLLVGIASGLWRQLGLEAFWEARLGEGREEVPWAKVLELLVGKPTGLPGQ